MASVNIKEVNGGEDTTPAGTDAIEIDNGTTSMWVLLSNLYKALGTGVATAAKALMGDGAWTTVTTPTSTETMTNKRITPRITTITSNATPTINTDDCDCVTITALAAAITSMTTNLSGTPTNFQKLLIRIKDNGTARAITWGTSFQSGSATLPTTTVLGKTLMVGLIYDSVDSKWTCEATGSRA